MHRCRKTCFLERAKALSESTRSAAVAGERFREEDPPLSLRSLSGETQASAPGPGRWIEDDEFFSRGHAWRVVPRLGDREEAVGDTPIFTWYTGALITVSSRRPPRFAFYVLYEQASDRPPPAARTCERKNEEPDSSARSCWLDGAVRIKMQKKRLGWLAFVCFLHASFFNYL